MRIGPTYVLILSFFYNTMEGNSECQLYCNQSQTMHNRLHSKKSYTSIQEHSGKPLEKELAGPEVDPEELVSVYE